MEVHHLWLAASEREREELAEVYQLGRQLPSALKTYVRFALLLEILERYDHRAWPRDYQLSRIEWQLQESILANCEISSVDRRQRASYMRLLMASKGRHRDVAYGLSERLLWRDKPYVIQQLIAMGKRNYFGALSSQHAMENGVLHVAVSYKHTSTYCRDGTISEQQANAIWVAVRSILLVNDDTRVRVWIDQNSTVDGYPLIRNDTSTGFYRTLVFGRYLSEMEILVCTSHGRDPGCGWSLSLL